MSHLSLQRKPHILIEKDKRFQKSLSEECEDLGVDEPSRSDLFPEAELLCDSNHSPSFDQDVVKKIKEEEKGIGLFCDDEPMRTDLLFEPLDYQSNTVGLNYGPSRDITNGRGNCSKQSRLSREDNTLLQTSTSMADVTIASPLSPEPYVDSSPPPLSKCKYKYTNRKKVERSKQLESWPMEVSSSEDTTGSTELVKNCSPELFSDRPNQRVEYDEGLYNVVGVERLPFREDEDSGGVERSEEISGRRPRRKTKKCFGCYPIPLQNASRKRPASRPQSPISQKKTSAAKQR